MIAKSIQVIFDVTEEATSRNVTKRYFRSPELGATYAQLAFPTFVYFLVTLLVISIALAGSF